MKRLIVGVMLLLGLVSSVFAVPAAPPVYGEADRTLKVDDMEPQMEPQAAGADLVDLTPWNSTIVFYALGLVGMGSHYVKKWARGQYAGNLWSYLFADNPRASLAAILTYSAAAAGVIATGSIDGMTLAQVAAVGFGTGYVSDSAVNAT